MAVEVMYGQYETALVVESVSLLYQLVVLPPQDQMAVT
jgi:hypothetical protein